MHHIYTTEALILKSFPLGEANKGYFLFTKDIGLVRATAQSVRSSKSKLKGHLSDFNFVEVSLVKGREIWRIINVETIETNSFKKDLKKLSILKNIFSLLIRLIHGEEKNENLFEVLKSFYFFLSKKEISEKNLKNLEVIVVIKVLYNLGYLKKIKDVYNFEKGSELSFDILDNFSFQRQSIIKEINDILKETHL